MIGAHHSPLSSHSQRFNPKSKMDVHDIGILGNGDESINESIIPTRDEDYYFQNVIFLVCIHCHSISKSRTDIKCHNG